MQLDKFIASIDRRRFWSNLAGYLIVVLMFAIGPEIQGLLGQLVWSYVWFYPIYYIGMLIYKYQTQKGKDE